MKTRHIPWSIDEHLSWKPHIQKISNKIARTLDIICRLKNFLPTDILRILYDSLILPHLQYSVLSWGFKMGRLDKLQKRAVRIISNSRYNSHTDPLFKKFNLLKLKDLFEQNVLKLFYKYRNNMLPFYVSNMFSDYTISHSYTLRSTYILNESGSNTPSRDKCIRHYPPTVINKLEADILNKISTHSFQGFAFYIKRTMINKYQTECDVRNCYVINATISLLLSNCFSFIYMYVCIFHVFSFFIVYSVYKIYICILLPQFKSRLINYHQLYRRSNFHFSFNIYHYVYIFFSIYSFSPFVHQWYSKLQYDSTCLNRHLSSSLLSRHKCKYVWIFGKLPIIYHLLLYTVRLLSTN